MLGSTAQIKSLNEPASNDLILTLNPNDMLVGQLTGEITPAWINVLCNNRHWATVPVTVLGGSSTFTCQLPPPRDNRETAVEVWGTSEDHCLARVTVPPRAPLVNSFGLAASEVLAVHPLPFHAAPYLQFDGARLIITGEHLPPAGDPSALRVIFGHGVAYELKYPLPSMAFGNHFWYWPNSHLSAFQIIIDLPACAPGSDPFSFTFEYRNGNPLELEGRHIGDALGRRVSIPTRLEAGIGLPRESDQLTRVQTWSNDQSVTFTGFSAFKTIESLFGRYGIINCDSISILDWGCGHGRVTRHFIQHWNAAQVCGTDIDNENIVWCQSHLAGEFRTAPLIPPTSFDDASFDGIFGISVMTHLSADVQAAWLDEIARLLKPNGVALITFGGSSAVAWSSVFRDQEFWQYWVENEFDDRLVDPALDGKISDATYYRHTSQSAAYTKRVWSKHLNVLDIIPEFIGNLDVAILKKNSSD